MQSHRLFQSRVEPARFELRPTIIKYRELLVGRRGEAPLVPPYILLSFKKAIALHRVLSQNSWTSSRDACHRNSEPIDFAVSKHGVFIEDYGLLGLSG